MSTQLLRQMPRFRIINRTALLHAHVMLVIYVVHHRSQNIGVQQDTAHMYRPHLISRSAGDAQMRLTL